MTNSGAVFKIGGELFQNKKLLIKIINQLKGLYESEIFDKIVILPGGGRLANFVRKLDDKLSLGNDISHWMAILAMDANGEYISNYCNLTSNRDPDIINNKKRNFSLFLPYDFLRKKDQLPHDWQVTSDSIALFLSYVLGFEICYLLKSVDGILLKNKRLLELVTTNKYKDLKSKNELFESNSSIKNSQPVDDFLMSLIDQYEIPCVLFNGKNLKKIIKQKDGKIVILPSTRIIPSVHQN